MYTILLILLAVAVPPTNQVTLSIPLQPGPEPELIAVVTFDADRVSATDVKRWMLLHESSYYDTPVVGYYGECKVGDIPKLEQDIKKTEQIVNDLDPINYPAELSDVVRHLRDLQSLWLWEAQQELEFLKSGKLPGSEYKGIDLTMCRVPDPDDKPRACHEVFHGWHNCVINRMTKQLGSYPVEKWKAFLDSYGIQEKLGSGMNLDE